MPKPILGLVFQKGTTLVFCALMGDIDEDLQVTISDYDLAYMLVP